MALTTLQFLALYVLFFAKVVDGSPLKGVGDVTIADRIRGAYMGAVVADALTLGTHYEYDAHKIKEFYGSIDRFYAPGEKNWRSNTWCRLGCTQLPWWQRTGTTENSR